MKLKMSRKIMIGLIASAAIAVVATPSEVYARGGHGGHGGWHGGHGGWRGGGYYRGFVY
jgi:Spy/CpxP family protein refolding chaperone